MRTRVEPAAQNGSSAACVLVAACLSVGSCLSGAAPALAQSVADDPAAEGESTEAAARFDEGVEHLRTERFEAAAEAFRASYRLEPSVTTMCNLALTYDRWGRAHHDRALRAYRTCARDDDTGRFRAYAERRIGEIDRTLALDERAEPPTPRVTPPPPDVVDTPPPPERPLPPPPSPDHTLLLTSAAPAALAAGALIGAIVLSLEAQSGVDQLLAELGPAPEIVRGSPQHRRLEDAQAQTTAAIALYATSGVLAAAALGLVIADLALASDDPAIAIVPTPSGVMASFSGAF